MIFCERKACTDTLSCVVGIPNVVHNAEHLAIVCLCAIVVQPSQQRRLKGRLRLCSRAIFFEPDYMKAPILMFPLAKVKKIEQLALPSPTTPAPNRISKWKDQQEGFVVETRMLVKMKEDGIDAPYVLEKKDSIWWFNFEFAPVQQVLFWLFYANYSFTAVEVSASFFHKNCW